MMKGSMRQRLTGFAAQDGVEGMRTAVDAEELMAAEEAELSGDAWINYFLVRV